MTYRYNSKRKYYNSARLFKAYSVEQLFQNYKSQDEYQRNMNYQSPKSKSK